MNEHRKCVLRWDWILCAHNTDTIQSSIINTVWEGPMWSLKKSANLHFGQVATLASRLQFVNYKQQSSWSTIGNWMTQFPIRSMESCLVELRVPNRVAYLIGATFTPIFQEPRPRALEKSVQQKMLNYAWLKKLRHGIAIARLFHNIINFKLVSKTITNRLVTVEVEK